MIGNLILCLFYLAALWAMATIWYQPFPLANSGKCNEAINTN